MWIVRVKIGEYGLQFEEALSQEAALNAVANLIQRDFVDEITLERQVNPLGNSDAWSSNTETFATDTTERIIHK